MTKKQMESLVAGLKIQSKKDSTVYEIVGIDLEQGKVILDNGKLYTMGTIQRWYSLYEEEIPEVVEPDNTILDDIEQADELTSEQDTTADTDTTAQDTDTTATTATNIQVNELHEDNDKTTKTHTTEGNTATNSTAKTNTVQPTIQQDNLIQSLNNLVDLHGCYLEAKKEYIAVKKDGYKGTVCMIRNCRYGNGIHIDMKSKIWIALDEEYRQVVSKDHYTGIYDKTRKLFRIGYVRDLDILQVVILTALQIAS